MAFSDIFPIGATTEAHVKAAINLVVRDLLNEISPSFWVDARLDEYIEMACVDISTKTHCVEVKADLTLDTAQVFYDSSDVGDIAYMLDLYAGLYYTTAMATTGVLKALQIIHPRHIFNADGARAANATPGTPDYIALFGHQPDATLKKYVIVYPPITATEKTAAGKVTLLYSKITDDVTEIPDNYRYLIIYFVVAMALHKDKAYGASTMMMNRYNNAIAINAAQFHTRPVESMDMLKLPDATVIR